MSEQGLETIPQSQEAERALIGVILFDNEVYNRVGGIVKPEDFYNPVHEKMFATISILIEGGKAVDGIILKKRFEQDDTIIEIGGVEYIARIIQEAPSGVVAREYAKLIADLAVRRDLIRLGGDMIVDANNLDGEDDADEQVSNAESKLFSLGENSTTSSGLRGMENIVIDYISSTTAAYKSDGGISGLPTGLECLDKQLSGLHRSDLIIIAGRPSMGKSALAAQIAYHVASSHREERQVDGEYKTTEGGRVAFFSLEMSDEQLAGRLIAMNSRVPSFAIRNGSIGQHQFQKVMDACDDISNIPLHIDHTGGLSIGALATRARRMKRTTGLDLIVVDYLQLLSGGKYMKATDGRVQEITHITMGLKALAKDLNIPVIALAQLSRQVEQRDDKRPQLSDLRESGSIEQDADVVMFVYREEYYHARLEPEENTQKHLDWQDKMNMVEGKAEIIIGKQRHGPIGKLNVGFEGEFTRFHEDIDYGG